MPIPPPPEVTQQIKAALDVMSARGVWNKCPACKSDKLSAEIAGLAVTSTPIVNIPTLYPLYPPSSVPMLVLSCMKCGHTQLHNLRIVLPQIYAPPSSQQQVQPNSPFPG